MGILLDLLSIPLVSAYYIYRSADCINCQHHPPQHHPAHHPATLPISVSAVWSLLALTKALTTTYLLERS